MAYERELQQLGLSDKEAKVYLAILELGSATVQAIAQRAGIPRPTAYVAIDELMRLGLVSFHERGKKRYTSAEFPERLLEVVTKKEEELRARKVTLAKILPALKRVFEYAGERPRVRFLEGKEGLRAIQEDFLRTKTKEAFEIYSIDDVANVFSEEERRNHREKLKKKHIRAKVLYTQKSKGSDLKAIPFAEMRRVDADHFPVSIDFLIYGDKVAIASLRGKLVGVIIENLAIAETFRSIFALAWRGARK